MVSSPYLHVQRRIVCFSRCCDLNGTHGSNPVEETKNFSGAHMRRLLNFFGPASARIISTIHELLVILNEKGNAREQILQ